MTIEVSYDQEQLRLMQEMCIIVDRDDQVIRPETKKKCHLMTEIEKGLLHRAFSVFIFNSENKLLLQQRADEKITFPGYFTNACCSHPLYCEEEMQVDNQIGILNLFTKGVKRACQRKLEHELGISKDHVSLDSLEYLTRIHYLAPSDGLWGEHEIDYIFILKGDLELDINPNEVKSTRYVSREELVQLFKDSGNIQVYCRKWISQDYSLVQADCGEFLIQVVGSSGFFGGNAGRGYHS